MVVSLKLVVEPGPGRAEAAFPLAGEDSVIGRDPRCDVVLPDASVSGRHGALRAGPGGYAYTDLGSRNGSAVCRRGGRPEPVGPGEAVPIRPGDVILLGSATSPVRLRVEEAAVPFAPAGSARTLFDSAPLTDLLGAGADATATLAARAITAETPEALAAAGLAWLEDAVPGSRVRSVLLCGAGFSATAGEPVPEDLVRVATETREVVMLRDGGARKTGPLSIAVVPLLAAGAWHGMLSVRSGEGQPLPRAVLKTLSVAGPLLALAAASLAVRREGEERRRALELKVREMAAAGKAPPTDPIGSSSVFRRALDLCRAVAPTDVPVLLTGETGTGKEVLARAIHRWSRRATAPFVAFNCAAIPETLIEAELFGHVRGAFTGATADRAGLFEAANGGTLLLDEIGEMPSHLQVKLLRAIQEGEIRRLGASRSVRVDVRVLSATNRDLPALVEAGKFRSDLMYRLNAVTVRVPPLRERRSDVPLLAHFLLGAACRQLDRRVAGFSPEALAGMWFREYPGNVRELENLVLRAVALTAEGHAIVAEALDGWPPEGDSPKTGATLQEAVEMAERLAVRSALDRNEGNLSRASRDLGLTRAGLYKLMVRLGMRERAARPEGTDETDDASGETGTCGG